MVGKGGFGLPGAGGEEKEKENLKIKEATSPSPIGEGFRMRWKFENRCNFFHEGKSRKKKLI